MRRGLPQVFPYNEIGLLRLDMLVAPVKNKNV